MNPVYPDQLEQLLLEDLAAVTRREAAAFDQAAAPFERSLVLFGAGHAGRKALLALRQDGIQPLAFADNNPALWNRRVDDLMVLSPQAAAEKYGQEAAFVVTIFNRHAPGFHIRQQLAGLGCQVVIPMAYLAWKYPDQLLPQYSLDLPHACIAQAGLIRKAFALLADDESRSEFLAHLRWLLRGEESGLAVHLVEEQYFPPDLFTPRPDQVFVDCGAYDGDTLQAFLYHSQAGFQRVVAIEPDPANYRKLKAWVDALAEDLRICIDLRQAAVGARRERVFFGAQGNDSSAVSKHGEVEVASLPLDELLPPVRPTYIKMDIEGLELEALSGAAHTLAASQPDLAICVYHRQDHLWKAPLFIASCSGGYHFYMRRYMPDCWEIVCYALRRPRPGRRLL